MVFNTHIAYYPDNQLSESYNRILQQTTDEWVLVLDHDVFLASPMWYDICVAAIEQLKDNDKVAVITCFRGGEHRKDQTKPPIDSIDSHINVAYAYYLTHGTKIERIEQHATGFFMLLNVKNARKIGFDQQGRGINNIDREFGKKALEMGYEIWRMKGLYVYHRRGMSKLRKQWLRE